MTVLKGEGKHHKRVTKWVIEVAILIIALHQLTFTPAQSLPINTSSITENGVSLTIEVVGLTYKKNSTITVKYEVRNKRREDIYVIIAKSPSLGYSLEPQRFALSLERSVFDDHYFEIPKLERLKPGSSQKGESQLPLSFLKNNFKAGQWFLHLSIGYLGSAAMVEISNLQKKGYTKEIARPFERLQEIQIAGPIEITLTE